MLAALLCPAPAPPPSAVQAPQTVQFIILAQPTLVPEWAKRRREEEAEAARLAEEEWELLLS